eukprot:jgi/Bigna1/76446/fgenesh1_pg.41_\
MLRRGSTTVQDLACTAPVADMEEDSDDGDNKDGMDADLASAIELEKDTGLMDMIQSSKSSQQLKGTKEGAAREEEEKKIAIGLGEKQESEGRGGGKLESSDARQPQASKGLPSGSREYNWRSGFANVDPESIKNVKVKYEVRTEVESEYDKQLREIQEENEALRKALSDARQTAFVPEPVRRPGCLGITKDCSLM